MNAFVRKYAKFITGTLTGFDRLIFRGRIRSWDFDHGPERYLNAAKVLLKDFGSFAQQVTNKLLKASLAGAHRLGRPTPYLNSSSISKLDTARDIARKDAISRGLICLIRCNEMAPSWKVVADRESGKLIIRSIRRPCLHLYHYAIHPIFGMMHARVQTYFPFAIQIWINGREWAARRLDSKRIEYVRRENCFTWKKKPVRPLNPWAPEDARILKALLDGAFTLGPFRNRDLQRILFATPATSTREKRRRCPRVSRILRILRAHGLIAKVPHTHRYRLLPKGYQTINALMIAREASVKQLNRLAS